MAGRLGHAGCGSWGAQALTCCSRSTHAPALAWQRAQGGGGHLTSMRTWNLPRRWGDMGGKNFTRSFRPPTKPMHVTFSLWSDPGMGFGGPLAASSTPFTSSFMDLRRVVCDKPAASSSEGPAWLRAADAAAARQ